jgi:putative Mg2+ transporter-C (MgtC) family protein
MSGEAGHAPANMAMPDTMPLHPTWPDIVLRLLLTVLAGAVLGSNREARGHAAGLRTTILVGLAACVAMIQANILLPVDGKTSGSFGVMDLMRLPLGILTGVGFIGGGAILRRGDMVRGVTTAATLWIMTVIGLCLGGGQLWLGMGATLLAMLTLWVLKWIDKRIPREHSAALMISAKPSASLPSDLAGLIGPLGYTARFQKQSQEDAVQAKLWFRITWKRPDIAAPPYGLVEAVGRRYRVLSFELTSEAHE